MSDNPTSDPSTTDSASIIADVLIVEFGEKALAFALDQKARAIDDSAEAWATVVKRLSGRPE